MTIGDRVLILPFAAYAGRFTGSYGTIVYISGLCGDKVGVKIDDRDNPASKYNAFWFKKAHVEIIESEETKMLNGYAIANIKFLDGTNTETLYSYALYDDAIQVGDTVVVKTGHHGFALAVVAEIAPEIAEPVKHGREIVAKVDFSAYEERQQRAKRMSELRTVMDAKVKELQNFAIYEMLAEKDPALKELLTEYKALLG